MKCWKVIVGLMVFVCASMTAMADNAYIHPGYDLRQVKEFRVTKIDNENQKPWENYTPGEDAVDEVMQTLYQVSTRKKKIIQDERNVPAPVRDMAQDTAPTAVELRVTIKLYGHSYGKKEGYYKEYTEMEDFIYYDAYGKKQVGSRPVKKKKWVPGYRWTNSYMKIKYEVYDIHTGELIGSIFENKVTGGFNTPWDSGDLRRSIEHVFAALCRKA